MPWILAIIYIHLVILPKLNYWIEKMEMDHGDQTHHPAAIKELITNFHNTIMNYI
jgi:hypothetical protein